MSRLVVQVLLGDIGDVEATLASMSGVASRLRQPAHLWEIGAGRAMLALAAGRLAEAEELLSQNFALGEGAKPEVAIPVHRLQRYTLGDFRGQLTQLEPEMRDLAAEWPARPAFRCALAHLLARLGRRAEAEEALGDLTRDSCAALPFDQEWLYAMSLLAETAVLLGDAEPATALHRLLAPWSAFNAADWPEGMRGSIARYLGLLATPLERWDEAADHFKAALEMNERMGLRPWLALTQEDYARMLLMRALPGDRGQAQQLLSRARASYRELGMTIREERAASR
jgi:tetratricopeptide (TPR) repeat protein